MNQHAASLANNPPNSAMRDQVAVDLNHPTATLDSKENALQTDNKLLKEEVKGKVEAPGKIIHTAGTVMGGLNDLVP